MAFHVNKTIYKNKVILKQTKLKMYKSRVRTKMM